MVRGSSSHQKKDVKKDVPGHGNENMNMSMDKPMAVHSIEDNRGSQVEKAKMHQKQIPRAWELKYEHVHGQTHGAGSH